LSGLIFLLSLLKILKMEKRSTHWADVLNWLQVVTDSCKTVEQANTCLRLLYNFERMYSNKIGFMECMELLRPIKRKLWDITEPSISKQLKLK
jgi:hypothetical protein